MEEANGTSQGRDTNLSSPGLTSQAPIQPAQSAPVQAPDERTFRQSEVNDIVKRAKLGAVDDFKRLQSEQPAYFQQKYGNGNDERVSSPQQSTVNASEHDIRRMAAEEAQRLRDTWVQEAQTKSQSEAAQRTVQNFWNKVNPGREKYQDFEKVTSDIELYRFPNVVQLLGDYIDNSDDMLYELGKDRSKLATLEQLAQMSPRDAIVQAQRLSQSLKDNATASKVRVPNEPLSQMRPSNAGTDNGAMSVKDYRAKYRV
jgi:hypothetical protein